MSGDAARVAEQEFEALIGPLVEPGLRLAYSMLGDRAEAEDATQEAITRAWRRLRSLRDRDQATIGEVGDARHRLMRDALAAREHVSHRAQWAAGIAAVLIAAIVITTFALIRGVGRPHATPAASPTATAQNLSVSDSTPILVIRESSSYQQIDAITWDGKAAGKLPFDAGGYSPNPAANLFASGGTIRD